MTNHPKDVRRKAEERKFFCDYKHTGDVLKAPCVDGQSGLAYQIVHHLRLESLPPETWLRDAC